MFESQTFANWIINLKLNFQQNMTENSSMSLSIASTILGKKSDQTFLTMYRVSRFAAR